MSVAPPGRRSQPARSSAVGSARPARSSSGSRPAASGSTAASMRCSAWAAFRTVLPAPEWRSWSAVRTSIRACIVPRAEVTRIGVDGSGMRESNAIAASPGPSSARSQCSALGPPISSSPSTTKRTCTGSSPAAFSSRAAQISGSSWPLSSVAPRAYRRPSRTTGSNGGVVQASAGSADCTS